MSSSAMNVLKERLARGEISETEFRHLQKVIRSSDRSITVTDVTKLTMQGLASAGNTSIKVYDSIFGSDSYQDPTDNSPLKITKDFSIFGSFASFNGERFLVSDVTSIGFRSKSQAVNFIPGKASSELNIILTNGKKIELDGFSVFIEGRTNKLLSQAYQILSTRTIENRFYRYMDQLNKNGYFQVGKVRITKTGYLTEGSTQVNLQKAAQNKSLWFGVTRGSNLNGSTNPYEVLAGESGVGLFSTKIKFEVTQDRDVIFHIMKMLAKLI